MARTFVSDPNRPKALPSTTVVPLDPGLHVVGTRMATIDDDPAEIEAEAGRSYYLRLESATKAMGLYFEVSANPVDAEVAQHEMSLSRRETDRYTGPAL